MNYERKKENISKKKKKKRNKKNNLIKSNKLSLIAYELSKKEEKIKKKTP
jgi:hypothetical protein